MRARKEIEEEVQHLGWNSPGVDANSGDRVLAAQLGAVVELLLDIRDLLQSKQTRPVDAEGGK